MDLRTRGSADPRLAAAATGDDERLASARTGDVHHRTLQPIEPLADLAALRSHGRASWDRSTADCRAVAAAALASAELAARAYGQGDPDARRQAESIIYFLNIDSGFAPPLHPVAGTVWLTLMHAKLAALRRELAGEIAGADPDQDEMAAQLEAAVARWGAYNHPLLDELERRASREAHRIWAVNWFGSCYGFSQQLAGLLQRTAGGARRTVLENLNDEFSDDATHDTLRVRFYESLGLRHSPETAIHDPDWVPESTELLNLRTGLCNLSDPLPALGCFYGVEANWPPECRRHHAMHKRRGVDDHVLQYWTTHASADEHHADDWLDSVKALCRTGAQRATVVEGAILQLRLRWRMYDSIREKVLALAS
jgi:pyrroloquinoline quinone (PQQ) biosynthesis protein C